MLIHNQFVFLQMRKTASTFIADALQQELRPDELKALPKHTGWGQIPSEASDRPVLAYVRNPWDWYVSWYHFNRQRPVSRDGFFEVLSQNDTPDFASTVRGTCLLLTALVGGDLYTTLFRNLIGDGLNSELLTIGRYESLIDDLGDFLAAADVAVPDGSLARICARGRLKASERGAYREYYDEELRDLVGESCAPLIDRFGYRF